MSNPLYYSTLIVHFTDIGRVKDLPGPVTDEGTVFHRALPIVIVVFGFTAVILGVLWKKCGKTVHIQTAQEVYYLSRI